MDMVLADAEGEYFRLTGEVYDHANPWPNEKRQAFYEKHGTFFRDLPWMKGSRLLLEYVMGITRTGICSSTSKHLPDQCRENKLTWLEIHGVLPRLDPVVITPPRANKGQHAKPGDILIDDYRLNIDRWNAAGGIGIHFQNALQAFDDLHQHLTPGNLHGVVRHAIEKELNR
jgi:hypothetical protein